MLVHAGRVLRVTEALALLTMSCLIQGQACPPQGYDQEALLQLAERDFDVAVDSERNELALALLDCVGHPDPAIRDGVVYSAYANWLRAGLLSPEAVVSMLKVLSSQLKAEDSAGFLQPFAALDLAEVARVDRIDPLLTEKQRQQLVEDASAYLANVRDYRGYSNAEGWRHGVAHGADLALQLVLNKNIGSEQIANLIDAVLLQIMPPGEVFYTFAEPSRLARPVYYAYLREELDPAAWDDLFARLADPAPLADWSQAWKDRAGLARRHNVLAFLQALYISADHAESPAAESLKQRALAVMVKLS